MKSIDEYLKGMRDKFVSTKLPATDIQCAFLFNYRKTVLSRENLSYAYNVRQSDPETQLTS